MIHTGDYPTTNGSNYSESASDSARRHLFSGRGSKEQPVKSVRSHRVTKRAVGVCLAAASALVFAVTPAGLGAAAAAPTSSARVVSVTPGQGQMLKMVVHSPSMDKNIPLDILRPRDTSTPAPTLYLLNGASGGDSEASWAARTDYQKFFADKHVTVVTPIAGSYSYFTDWIKDDPVLGRNKWQTFLTKELPPVIDGYFNTTKRNALAGISMAGTSVLNLAIAAPKLYRSVAGFSGCARTSDPLGQAYIYSVVTYRGKGNMENMWGPLDGPGWRANDPYLNAAKLRGVKVYLTAGSGLPGKYEQLNSFNDHDPAALFDQLTLGGLIEAPVDQCTRQVGAKLRQSGVATDVTIRPQGSHSWGWWQEDLHNTWPKLAADLGR